MQTTTEQAAEILAGGAQRSRFIFSADRLQESAEIIFISAGEIEQEVQSLGQIQLFTDVLAIAASKGFQHSDLLRSLVRQRTQQGRVRELAREVIHILGGPGDFWDTVDLITWPDERGIQ